jgi:hypothetical protein
MERQIPSKRNRRASSLRSSSADLEREVADLLDVDTDGLREKWVALCGTEPPRRLGRSLLVRAIAYQLQENALGGLKASAQRVLARVCDEHQDSCRVHKPAIKATAGTVLVREWRGVRHRVTVLDQDVVYRGQRYKSLSEVARVITGTRWSGPRFFGLIKRMEATAVDG